MNQLIELAQDNIPWVGFLLIFLSLFFEFSKIKLNPLSWMFKALSTKITEDIHKENLAIHKENEDIHKENENINKRLDDVVYIKSKHYAEIVKWQEDTDQDVSELKLVNSKIMELMDNVNSKIDQMHKSQDENEMYRMRWEILSFADSLKAGNKHSKDAFHHIFEINDKYHVIIDKRKFVNGVIDVEMEYITELYKELSKTDDFN